MKKINNLMGSYFKEHKLNFKIKITILFLMVSIARINANVCLENKFDFKIEEQTQSKISGIVLDELNQPMFGVNIIAKGTKTGTSTSFDGRFSLTLPYGATTIVVSFLGYKTQEIVIGDRTEFKIQIYPESSGLNEVIVVGYGTQKKKDILGAISSVKGDDLTLSSSPSILQGIQGKAAGLQISQTSAQPGGGLNIQIRGGGSTEKGAGNNPLVVVDGFVITDFEQPVSGNRYDGGTQGILNSFNPNDIESVEVLKDAAAAAIYGSRAANGVILITTKKGKVGDVKVDYSNSTSFQAYNKNYDVLNLKEWMQLRNDAAFEKWQFENRVYPYSSKTLAEANAAPVNGIAFKRYFSDQQIRNAGNGTDWLSLVTRDGAIQQHNLSLRGGTNSTKYFMSGNFYNHDGVVKNSGFKRTAFRINLDQKINDYINFGMNLTTSNIKNDYVPLGGQFNEDTGEEVSQYENSGIIRAALQQSPYIPAVDEFGNYPINPELSQQPNPYSLLTITDEGTISRTLSNFFLEIKPFKGFTARFGAGYDKGEGTRNTYLPRTTLAGAQENGRASVATNRKNDDLYDFTLTYTKRVKENHNFTLLLGSSLQTYRVEENAAGNSNFVTDAFLWNNLNAGAGTKVTTSTKRESNNKSYFGRFNYSYKDKYLLTAIVRRDFDSGNSANYKWGTFPSISFGWDMASESFMKSIEKSVSQLKIRFGYGTLGNTDREGNAFAAYSSYPGYLSPDESILQGVFLTRLANPDLKWETTTEKNFGLDFEILNRRISGSLEVYNRVVSDLIVPEKALNSYHEVSTIAANVGATETNGIELSVNTVNISSENFKWKSNFIYSTYKTNWKERAPDWKPAVYESYNDPLRAQYAQLSDGIMQVGEVVPAQPDLYPGQIKIKDINGFVRDGAGNPVTDANGIFLRTGAPDGKIDVADTVLLGSSDPDYVIGFGNTIVYKNFQLNFQFNGSFGRKIVNQTDLVYGTSADGVAQFGYNATTRIYDRWTPDNPSTTRPGSNYGYSQYGVGDFFLEDASFVRLQTVSLTYKLPIKWASKYLTSAGIRLDAQNLFVITKYKGIDPETDGYTAAYPNVKTYTLGIDLKF
jgi:TonB-linked SusC/RagA family outer membrane protein